MIKITDKYYVTDNYEKIGYEIEIGCEKTLTTTEYTAIVNALKIIRDTMKPYVDIKSEAIKLREKEKTEVKK